MNRAILKITPLVSSWIFILLTLTAYGQKVDTTYAHKQIVREFYKLLYQKSVSISESTRIFGQEAMLWEEHLYMQKCLKKNNEENCAELLGQWLKDPSKTKSLLFTKLFSLRDSLAPGGSVEQAIRKMKFRRKTVAELSFSGKVVIVMFTNPEFDAFCITSVFLPGGASIFNIVDGVEKVHYK